MKQIEVFSPVNIAWLKYMGKTDVANNRPANPSLSVTLKNAGTHVMARATYVDALSVQFGGRSSWLDETGRKRVEAFLTRIEPLMKDCLIRFGINPILKSVALDIETENTIPERAGIASSASSFSAYTLMFALALSQDQSAVRAELDKRGLLLSALAQLSSLGSGSSGRSMFAPFCLWDESGFHSVRSQFQQNYVHMIVIFEDGPKTVSSSLAHLRVPSSRYFKDRKKNVMKRYAEIAPWIEAGRLLECANAVSEEALEMHLLFETADPPFSYLTLDALAAARHLSVDSSGVLTIDAGTNLHWLTEKSETEIWQKRFKEMPGVKRVLIDEIGGGPRWG